MSSDASFTEKKNSIILNFNGDKLFFKQEIKNSWADSFLWAGGDDHQLFLMWPNIKTCLNYQKCCDHSINFYVLKDLHVRNV
jgi:hypothetical protein